MKKLFKISGISLLTFLLLIGLYLLAAFCLSRIAVPREDGSTPDVTIYILTNGVHTDIVVPAQTEQIDWFSFIPVTNTTGKDSSAAYLALGWGDKGFYLETPTWDDLKFSTAFKAAFNLSSSAMHTTYYRSMQEGADCKKIMISYAQYARLIAFIKARFDLDGNGFPIYIDTRANYGSSDAFYEAKGSYNLFYTCNTWTNNSLKSCGQKACLWTIFDTGIFYHYK